MDEVIKNNTLTLAISTIITVILSIIISVIIYFLSKPKSPGIVNVGGFDLSNMNAAPYGSSGGGNSGEVVFNNKDIGGGDMQGGGVTTSEDNRNLSSNYNKSCGNFIGGC